VLSAIVVVSQGGEAKTKPMENDLNPFVHGPNENELALQWGGGFAWDF
jgi:hypothetical protein